MEILLILRAFAMTAPPVCARRLLARSREVLIRVGATKRNLAEAQSGRFEVRSQLPFALKTDIDYLLIVTWPSRAASRPAAGAAIVEAEGRAF
jgi:hypothetical protein